MTGPNYRAKEPEITGDIIRLDMNWWGIWRQTHDVSSEDLAYLTSIIKSQAICPPLTWIENTERARKILGI